MDISIKHLSAGLLDDFLFFFDNIVFTENPDWSRCYCYSFHFVGTDDQWNRDDNRSAVIKLIKENKMTGYLAYFDNEPVGWCNANNRPGSVKTRASSYAAYGDKIYFCEEIKKIIPKFIRLIISDWYYLKNNVKSLSYLILPVHASGPCNNDKH